jgi:streptogramin lyase
MGFRESVIIRLFAAALILAGSATAATGCADSENGTAVPPAGGIDRSTSVPAAGNERAKIAQFDDLPGYAPEAFPDSVVAASGNLWVTVGEDQDYGRDSVVAVATSGKRVKIFHARNNYIELDDISAGSDGALWMTDAYNSEIVRMTLQGAFKFYPVPRAEPYNIAAGPDKALWFTAAAGSNGAIGRITTSGKVTIFAAPASTEDIATGADGALWFTEPYVNRIGRITTSGQITEYSEGITAQPNSLALGPDGAMWFTENAGAGGLTAAGPGIIGRITTAGQVTEYVHGITAQLLCEIAAGPDRAMWFTESNVNSLAKIGRISLDGTITEYSANLDSNADPTGIAAGPDGNMWFAETGTDKMGRVKL